MNILDTLSFVKEQTDYHKRRGAELKLEGHDGRSKFHERLADQSQATYCLIEELAGPEAVIEKGEVGQMNGGANGGANGHDEEETLAPRHKLRLGDTASLPPELLKQLSATRDDTDQDILCVVRDDFGGTAAIDEILVGLYRKTGKVHERTPLYTRLYRMLSRGLLYPVPHRKGVYSVNPAG